VGTGSPPNTLLAGRHLAPGPLADTNLCTAPYFTVQLTVHSTALPNVQHVQHCNMCTSYVHFTALHCDMCHMCHMCNMCYMCNICNASHTALYCIAACVLHCALCCTAVHCGTAPLCCSWAELRSRCSQWGSHGSGVFVTPGCPTHRD
jgi:hypothetical protein